MLYEVITGRLALRVTLDLATRGRWRVLSIADGAQRRAVEQGAVVEVSYNFV